MTAAKQTVAETAGTALAQNPTTTTIAVGMVLQGVGELLGWADTTHKSVGIITMGLAILIRTGVLAWQNARRGK